MRENEYNISVEAKKKGKKLWILYQDSSALFLKALIINAKVLIQPVFKVKSQKIVFVNFWVVRCIWEFIFNNNTICHGQLEQSFGTEAKILCCLYRIRNYRQTKKGLSASD